jgi:hypothetical protein
MKIPELITLLSNKIASLNNSRSNAIVSGDVEAVLKLDNEISDTQVSLNKLQGLV